MKIIKDNVKQFENYYFSYKEIANNKGEIIDSYYQLNDYVFFMKFDSYKKIGKNLYLFYKDENICILKHFKEEISQIIKILDKLKK